MKDVVRRPRVTFGPRITYYIDVYRLPNIKESLDYQSFFPKKVMQVTPRRSPNGLTRT